MRLGSFVTYLILTDNFQKKKFEHLKEETFGFQLDLALVNVSDAHFL